MRCFCGDDWYGTTMTSIRKAKAKSPSAKSDVSLRCQARYNVKHTNESHNLDFLSKLILVSCSNPISITSVIWNIPDTSEHVSRSHNKRGDDGASCPTPFTTDDGRNKPEEEKRAQDSDGDGNPTGQVDRITIGNRNRRVFGQIFGQWARFKATAERYLSAVT